MHNLCVFKVFSLSFNKFIMKLAEILCAPFYFITQLTEQKIVYGMHNKA